MDKETRDRIWKDEYEHWLTFYKKQWSEYDSHLKLCYADAVELQKHVTAIVELLDKNKIWLGNSMKRTDNISIRLGQEDKKTIEDVVLYGKDTCGHTLMLEPLPEEIEAKARSMADFEVECREHKEHEAEEAAKKEAKDKAEAEAYWKAHPEYGQHQDGLDVDARNVLEQYAALKNKENSVESWTEQVTKELDDKSNYEKFDAIWSQLPNKMRNAIYDWLSSCQSFCTAMNEGLSGFGLYAHNSDRALKHEKMFKLFKTTDNAYAESITKQYDFACTYDLKTDSYTMNDFDEACRKLAYALSEALEIAKSKAWENV